MLVCLTTQLRLNDQPGGDEVSTLLTEIKLFPGDFEAACNGWGSGKVEQPAFGRLVRSRRWPAAWSVRSNAGRSESPQQGVVARAIEAWSVLAREGRGLQ